MSIDRGELCRRNSANFVSVAKECLQRRFSSTEDVTRQSLDNDGPSKTLVRDDLSQSRKSLVRQDTFVIGGDDSDNEFANYFDDDDDDDRDDVEGEEEEAEENQFLGKSTTSLVERGIRRMLEGSDVDGVDKSVREEFSSEVRAYIASHFRMIREENTHLRKTLQETEKQVQELNELRRVGKQQRRELLQAQDEIKKLNGQLERERIKNKAIVKRMKELVETPVTGSTTSCKSFSPGDGIFWCNLPNPPQTLEHRPGTSDSRRLASLSRPGTAQQQLFDDSPKGSAGTSKKLRSFKIHTVQLQKEVDHLKEILLREIGSKDGVEEALKMDASRWKGRAERISELEKKVENLRKTITTDQQGTTSWNNSDEHKTKLFESRGNSPDDMLSSQRDSGDGSSRQDDLSDNFVPSIVTPSVANAQNQREMVFKLHEYRTICQVSEVERERLGEHVRVLTKKLRSAEETSRENEVVIREERRRNAYLERMLEKARMELAAKSQSSPPPVTSMFLNDELSELKEKLAVYEAQIKSLEQKNDSDLEMYLKMLADTRRSFTQALKLNYDAN